LSGERTVARDKKLPELIRSYKRDAGERWRDKEETYIPALLL
jgi:hypothetical protein